MSEKPTTKIRRLPLIVIASSILFFLLGFLWVTTADITPTDTTSSGDNKIPSLAPVPPPANFIDRSDRETMRVEGSQGVIDEEILLLGGKSKIEGRVILSDGSPVKQRATVELTRWEGLRFNSMKVTTDFDGKFEVSDLRGGRWSGRAWLAPNYPSRESAAWFLTDEQVLATELTTADEVSPEESISVSPPGTTFDFFDVTFLFLNRTVDENGRVIEQPAEGEVTFSWPSGYEGPSSGVLQGGRVTVQGKCLRDTEGIEIKEGAVRFNNKRTVFVLPRCTPRPTTTEPPPTSTTAPQPTTPPTIAPTTTTAPPNTTTTTTPSTSTTIVTIR